MNEDLNIIINLPVMFFGICFIISVLFFIWAGFRLVRARKEGITDEEKLARANKSLSTAFFCLLGLLLVMGVFFGVSALLKKGDVFNAPDAGNEIPGSPAYGFPPAPNYVKVANYYFNGPLLLKNYSTIGAPITYAILCKKNDNYDIININTGYKVQLLKLPDYKCWLDNCNNNLNDIYIGVFRPRSEEIKESLIIQLNPVCSKAAEAQ
jgi:hypothetical protein